jgi:hypothetical protein
VPPTVARMRPITLICALAATLQLPSSDAVASSGWTWPIRGPVLTPYRNGGDPYAAGQHRGLDIGAPVGSRVVAAAGGTVTFAGVVGSSGLTVSERTADGRYDLSYLHLSSVGVHRGDRLAAGAAVGAAGVSGRRSVAAPHLHFGVRQAGTRSAYVDPLDLLPPPPPADRAPRPVPGPAPVAHPAAPGAGRVPRGRAVHSRFPAPAPHPAPAAHTASDPVQLPHAAPAHHPPHAHGRPALPHMSDAPAPLRGPAAAPARTPSRAAPTPAQRGRRHPDGGGIDAGWLLACLGMIGAATALARPDKTLELATRGRTRVTAFLRPASRGS